MHQKLTGQVALVTGGSRGMGAAIAVRLAADGADVAFSYAADPEKGKKTLAAIEATGRRGLAVKADQADPRRAQHLVRQVADHFGRLDILVNNAGVHVTGKVDAPDRDQSAFDRQLAINFKRLSVRWSLRRPS